MISLTKVEELASEIDPSSLHAAISTQDETQGEKIILFTTSTIINRENFTNNVRKAQVSLLYIPKIVITLPEIPLLANGKVNYLEMIRNLDKYTNE